ncbi:DUF4394 domain-containing protein [Hymenobacter sp. B1770]|uniref:DUF4394 domain-containing protein n=1 Tax=Hymenobacter sp. B1770 TaxID=1718788 RepID=UPI003CECF090
MRQLFTFTRLAAVVGLLLLGPVASRAQTAYGLITTSPTTSSLVTFQVSAPTTFIATVPVVGLATGQVLVGLDSRPNTGELFALGYNIGATQIQLYTLNPITGALTPVGGTLVVNLGTNRNRIGFDFNPTVDRIRLTGANNSNFRLNPDNGALAATDGTLAYAASDPNAAQTPGVGAVAYGNSSIGATATTLYAIDEANSRLTVQNPPDNGTLNTVGTLGINTSGTTFSTDLDIYTHPTTGANQAYLSVSDAASVGGFTNALYTVDLTTGATTQVAALGVGTTMPLTDIALAITRTVPATVTGNLAYGLAGSNLISFDTALPGTIRTSVGITGVNVAQTLVGLDIRPLTNTLYALGYNATAQSYQLYALNAATGVATPVNATPIALPLGTGKIGFDFNPVADRIRVVSTNRANYRLNPIDGTIAGTDTQLAYATGDRNAGTTPNIGAVAYTNSVAGTTATTTTLYGYDLATNVLTLINPPNDGNLISVGTMGNSGITVNATVPNVDLDIYTSAAGAQTMYLLANTGTGLNSSLYTISSFTITSAATLVGAIGNGIAVRDIAVAAGTGVATAVRERLDLATGFSVFPNPMTSATRLAFTLTQPGRVEVGVFDVVGRCVGTQASGLLGAGLQVLAWQAAGQKPGLYTVRLVVNGQPAAVRQVVVE